MQRIASFSVNHDLLDRGVYLSRTDGDLATYDIRMKVPNRGDYLENGALHTIEHLFATYARNSRWADAVVYFGPMGCRTGFYLLTRGLPHQAVLELIREGFAFMRGFTGEIPGSRRAECGNYLEHDLAGARAEAAAMEPVLAGLTPADLTYRS